MDALASAYELRRTVDVNVEAVGVGGVASVRLRTDALRRPTEAPRSTARRKRTPLKIAGLG